MNLTLKNQLELSTEFYNNIHKIKDVEKEKELIIKQYSIPPAQKDKLIKDIMSDINNFEIYESKYCPVTAPPILIVNYDIIKKHTSCEATLYYLLNKTDKIMLAPIILISSRLFQYGNTSLLEYVILHEIGHFRLGHIGDRNILNEVEADMYACDSIGIEGFISGMQGLISYIESHGLSTNIDLSEIKSRFKFVVSRKGIRV